MEDITGATTMELAAASPSELVSQVNEAARNVSLLPLVILLWLPVVTIPPAILLYARDKARRTVVAFYEVDARRRQDSRRWLIPSRWYSSPLRTGMSPPRARSVRRGSTRSTPALRRLLRRDRGRADLAGPAVLATNIAVPSLHARKRSVYFLPDRILVRDGRHYADLPYSSCRVTGIATRFIEEGPVPRDGRAHRDHVEIRKQGRRPRPAVQEQPATAHHAVRGADPDRPAGVQLRPADIQGRSRIGAVVHAYRRQRPGPPRRHPRQHLPAAAIRRAQDRLKGLVVTYPPFRISPELTDLSCGEMMPGLRVHGVAQALDRYDVLRLAAGVPLVCVTWLCQCDALQVDSAMRISAGTVPAVVLDDFRALGRTVPQFTPSLLTYFSFVAASARGIAGTVLSCRSHRFSRWLPR